MITWVIGGRVSSLRNIYTSLVNINFWSNIVIGIWYGILRHIYTFTIVTTSITTVTNPKISRGRVAIINISISTSSITRRHSNTLIIRNTIVIEMVVGIMVDILWPISKNYITNHIEIDCLAVVVDVTLIGSPLNGFVPLSWSYRWCQVMNYIGIKGSIASVSRD